MRRFARRAVTLDGGVYVVAAETASRQVASVARRGLRWPPPPGRSERRTRRPRTGGGPGAFRASSEAGIAPEPPSRSRPVTRCRYGARFGDALAFLQRPPILAESRSRLARAVDQRHAALGDAIEIVETDVGLATAVLSAANQHQAKVRGRRVGGRRDRRARSLGTLRLATPFHLRPAAPGDRLSIALSRISAHSTAARSAAEYLARSLWEPGRDELRLAGLLHDLGKVALVALRDDYLAELSDHSATPKIVSRPSAGGSRIDHAAIGALALRRLGLPGSIVKLVDRHHSDEGGRRVAIIRLADMLAHMSSGDPVSADALVSVGERLALEEDALHAIAYELQRTRGARTMANGRRLSRRCRRRPRGSGRGQALQADRGRPRSGGEHRAQPHAQPLPQARRRRPRACGPACVGAGLDMSQGRVACLISPAWTFVPFPGRSLTIWSSNTDAGRMGPYPSTGPLDLAICRGARPHHPDPRCVSAAAGRSPMACEGRVAATTAPSRSTATGTATAAATATAPSTTLSRRRLWTQRHGLGAHAATRVHRGNGHGNGHGNGNGNGNGTATTRETAPPRP